MIRGVEQRADRVARERRGVGVGLGDGEVSGLVEAVLGHAEFPERGRRAEVFRQVEQAAGGISGVQRGRDAAHRLGRRFGVVGGGVGQDDGMHLGVRQIEGAAERVAQLVVQGEADRAERRGAQPGAVERIAARGDISRIGHDARQAAGQRGDALFRHQVGKRRRLDGIERLDRVRDRIHAAGGRDGPRQRDGEFGIVDHGARHHLGVGAGGLDPVRGDAPQRRHLRAGIGRRHGEQRQAGVAGDHLAQPDGRAAADRDDAVGVPVAGVGERRRGDVGRHVHPRVGVKPRGRIA